MALPSFEARESEQRMDARRTAILVGVAAVFVGGAALVLPYLTGRSASVASAARWVFAASPFVGMLGGALYAFKGTRRHGLRLVIAGTGVVLGGVAAAALLLVLFVLLTR